MYIVLLLIYCRLDLLGGVCTFNFLFTYQVCCQLSKRHLLLSTSLSKQILFFGFLESIVEKFNVKPTDEDRAHYHINIGFRGNDWQAIHFFVVVSNRIIPAHDTS